MRAVHALIAGACTGLLLLTHIDAIDCLLAGCIVSMSLMALEPKGKNDE